MKDTRFSIAGASLDFCAERKGADPQTTRSCSPQAGDSQESGAAFRNPVGSRHRSVGNTYQKPSFRLYSVMPWLLAFCLGGSLQAQDNGTIDPGQGLPAETASDEQPATLKKDSNTPMAHIGGGVTGPAFEGPTDGKTVPGPTIIAPPMETDDTKGNRVEWLGQTWVLGRHQGGMGTETDEYFTDEEGPGEWSQVVAVQRADTGTVAKLKARLGNTAGLQYKVLQEEEGSCVLSLAEAGEGGRVGVMLVQQAGPPRGGLIVISYLQRNARLEETRAGLQLDAWRERLLAQSHRKPRREAERTPPQP